MAQKKKKRPSRKQQIKDQRRAAIARKRKEQGWKPSSARSSHPRDEVIDDMLPLFPRAGDTSASSAASLEQLMITLLASEDLVEEPEFESIIIDPLRCVDTFVEVAEELGTDPEALRQLPDDKRDETQMQLMEITAQRLLTDELRVDVINALNQLRLRLKKARQRKKAARVAAFQSFLRGSETSQLWPSIGLVQALVQRSLMTGFDMLEAASEALGVSHLDGSETPLALSERLAQSRLGRKANKLLQKVPGLGGYLEKQAETIWQEGVDAVFAGELNLGLFTQEELEAGLSVLVTTLEEVIGEELAGQAPTSVATSEEKAQTLFLKMSGFLTELLTPVRLDQLRRRLDACLNDSDLPKRWLPFALMLRKYMADAEAIENERHFLISAFIGELRAVEATFSQDKGEQE
ncbi:MAG: hypothetical protein JSV81_03810 [Anaerolineales bacterium]|nr:MAG: hypothetical protein JSV81_03810 [Anaerolineales bacterium]